MENSNIFIRKYQKGERKQVQDICLVTGAENILQHEEMKNMLLTAFCNYYIEREPYNCFVALDGEKVVGYILCAENAAVWAESFQDNYVKNLVKSELMEFYKGIIDTPLKYINEYPAHLHIDILPSYQRMGIGTKLMDAIISHLKVKGVPGLMLSVASDNIKGIKFYEKYGFTVLDCNLHEIVMGMRMM